MSQETIKLSRDCPATEIPSGNQIILRAGTQVRITQVAGASYTVMTDLGQMASIAGMHAEAIGKKPVQEADPVAQEGTLEEQVDVQLKTCFDPEIPINIVDLGLVYERHIVPLDAGGKRLEIKMTLTAPGCGMGEWLKKDVESKVLKVPEIKEVDVQLVWDPPWNRDSMSDAAKLQLGMM